MKIIPQQITAAQHYRALFDQAQYTLETVCREFKQTDLCIKKLYRKKRNHLYTS